MSVVSHDSCRASGYRTVLKLLYLCILMFGFFQTSPSLANSNVLLEIVQQCLRTETPAYCEQCRAPQQIANCAGKTSCRATSEVWAENSEFVAIRDIKMCGCPPDFVHGLVMPKATVTGIEDSRRPDSIWSFSWQVALERLKSHEIALAVNPLTKRTQNQLHVHVVRLKPGFNDKQSQHVVVSTRDLNAVWRLAQQAADERKMPEYGVLVSAAANGEFLVTLTSQSPEGQFTQAVCTP
jgi:CDP-diacylglycerol pyrophosphatase